MPETKRAISPGAEGLLQVKFPVLDHGYVMLVDYMGSDSTIAERARISTGSQKKSVKRDTRLIRRLSRDRHTSPSEMGALVFLCQMPLFVARQWVRHRTASLNELSGRYSTPIGLFYLPDEEDLRKQDEENPQMSSDQLIDGETASGILARMERYQELARREYKELIKTGLARETARINMPLTMYTRMYWKMDIHNLFGFLRLRLAEDAQPQIRKYAQTIAEITKKAFPISYQAFEDYVLGAVTLSRMEANLMAPVLANPRQLERLCRDAGLVQSEIKGFRKKLNTMGLLK
jgi:thymidylate synthase (FAD)